MSDEQADQQDAAINDTTVRSQWYNGNKCIPVNGTMITNVHQSMVQQ